MIGSPEPMASAPLRSGNNWIKVVSADITSAACINMIESADDNPATPATMIAGVTHPTIIATTCCSANGIACEADGFPSILNNSPEAPLIDSLLISFFISSFSQIGTSA